MIIDIVGGLLVVVGSALMALGAFGLLRFPDVFTRMHAATKAATVGVIATTTGASIEAGAVGGALILLVVVALLFLEGLFAEGGDVVADDAGRTLRAPGIHLVAQLRGSLLDA